MSKKKHGKNQQKHPGHKPPPVITQQHPAQPQPCYVTVECKLNNDPHPEKKWSDIALHNKWLIILTLGTIAVGTAVTIVYYCQLRIMQNTFEQSLKQTRLSVRPWVGLDEGLDAIQTTPLEIDKDGNASLAYQIRAKNYSTSPATNVWSMANLVVADDLNTVYEQQGFACGDAVIGKPDIGLVLFQGRDRVFNSMPSSTKISLKHGKGYQISVWLAGCIGYRDQFNYLCRTKFIWAFYDDANRPVILQAPVQAMTITGHFMPTASGGAVDTCQIPKYK